MQFHKIKRESKGVTLVFQKPGEKGHKPADITFRCADEPNEEFDACLQSLAGFFQEMLGLAYDLDQYTIRSVVIGEKETLIAASVEIDGINRPLNIASPLIPNEPPDSEENPMKSWGAEMMGVIDDLQDHAAKYYRGERQDQPTLELDE